MCLLAIVPLRADPVPSLDQLTVIDQGSQITLLWHCYYKLLPQKFTVPESGGQVDLTDPKKLTGYLDKLARTTFLITVDGRPAQPADLSSSSPTLAADGGFYVGLTYAGHKNARVELRETILPLYPSSYIINYEIYSPLARSRGVTGYFTGGAPPPVVEYTQVGEDYTPSLFDALNAAPVRLFKAELRAAWINPSWLFLILIVLLLRPARELYPLAWIMAMAWILPIFLWAAKGTQIPITLHPIIPAIATAGIAALFIWKSPPFAAAALAVALAGLLNGCLEIQQTTLERPPPDNPSLAGLVLGLITGFALIFAIALPLLHECRKNPDFQRNWAPKIAAALAVFAIGLAIF